MERLKPYFGKEIPVKVTSQIEKFVALLSPSDNYSAYRESMKVVSPPYNFFFLI